MTDLPPRLRAVLDLGVPAARENAGLHAYDGVVPDLSDTGVAAALSRLGGPVLDDPLDEQVLAAAEAGARVAYGHLGLHRRNPVLHLSVLDVSSYDRVYAPLPERAEARRRHLARWPDAVDVAVRTLDAVPRDVAAAMAGPVRGLAAAVRADDGEDGAAARAAVSRLAAHLDAAASTGDPDPALGAAGLAALLGVPEALEVDPAALAAQAETETARLRGLLAEACTRLAPGRPTREVVDGLLADHPDAAGVLDEARAQTAEVLAFTAERGLAPHTDGDCLVGVAPESRRWGMAMMSWAAPEEPDAASWYHVTPPDPTWPVAEQAQWLQVFSRATLPAITVHEVAPGHYAHGRALRRVPSLVRRVVLSDAFVEGWAHDAEEVCLEEGFRDGDPRFAVGVAVEALVRVTRMACAVGLHTGAMTVDDATARFEADAFLAGPAARSEALRGTFDPTYGRYTWGKLLIRDLRARARAEWGAGYTHLRFSTALLGLGAPPLGLLDAALSA